MPPKCVCVCLCVHVSTPEAIYITSGVILILNDWLNNCGCFQFRFMALAVNVIDRRGPSNEMRRQ